MNEKKFKDRRDAGLQLGHALQKYETKDPIVLAIPRGGVVVGYYVAEHLECEFSVIVCRKLGYTAQPELAFGAITEGRSLYMDPRARVRISRADIMATIQKEQDELMRRVERYRNNQPLPDLKGRTIILVDDGIATGNTIMAAINACRKMRPDTLIVASPVSSPDTKRKLLKTADEVVILVEPEYFYAVSQVYEIFNPVEDSEVLSYLTRISRKRASSD